MLLHHCCLWQNFPIINLHILIAINPFQAFYGTHSRVLPGNPREESSILVTMGFLQEQLVPKHCQKSVSLPSFQSLQSHLRSYKQNIKCNKYQILGDGAKWHSISPIGQVIQTLNVLWRMPGSSMPLNYFGNFANISLKSHDWPSSWSPVLRCPRNL